MAKLLSFLSAVPARQDGRNAGLRGIRRRTRLVAAAFAVFGCLLFALGAWRAVSTFRSVKNEERLKAQALAARVAGRFGVALNKRFADLRFLGHALLEAPAASGGPANPVKQELREFLAAHPMLRSINVLNAHGTRILWSARRQAPRPLVAADRFHALLDNPYLEVADPLFAKRFHTMIVPLRYRIASYRGRVRFLIGDPLDLRRMPDLVPRTTLTVEIVGQSGESFATWANGVWRRPRPLRPRPAGRARAPLPGYGWTIAALWSRPVLWGLWWQHVARWLPLFIVLLWGSQYTGLLLVNLLSQEIQLRLWHEGLYRINQSVLRNKPPRELFAEAAQTIWENLDAEFVFVGSRSEFGVAGPSEANPSIIAKAFAIAVESDWKLLSETVPAPCWAIAFGETGAVIIVCPSRDAQTVVWYAMARELAGHLTGAINQQLQRREIERLERYQAAVRLMQLELLRQPTPRDVRDLLVRILAEQTDILGAFVAIPEPSTSWLYVETAAAQDPEVREALLRLTPSRDPDNRPFGQMLAGHALRTRTPHGPVDPHNDHDLRAAMAEQPALARVRAEVAYPILEDGSDQPTAILVVDSADPEYFTPALRALLEHLIASVRLALNAYRTRRQIDRYRRFYEALARASQVIARRSHPSQMFRNICHILAESTGVPLVFLSRLDGPRIEIVASAGACTGFLDTSLAPLSHPAAILHEQTTASREPCLFERREDWLADEGLREAARALGLVSALTVPWVHRDGVAGILAVIAGERAFFDEDLTRLMETLGHDISFGVSDHDRQQELLRLSLYDSLTGLPNRAYFERSTISALARAARSRQTIALAVMDLDGFKEWNDLQGHAAGDELLKTVAAKLREVVREGEGVARLGGDEFGLAVTADNLDALTALSVRLLTAVGQADPEKRVTASLGWATCAPGEAIDYTALLVHADEALYAAKADGRNTFRVFGGDIAARLNRRLAIHKRFPAALSDGQILFLYQPQVHCVSGETTGVELLARWQDGSRLIPAEDFISDIEKDPRLIRALGRQALIAAVALRNRLAARGHAPRIGVNIGAHHFLHSAFIEEVKATLAGSSATGLCIEVTGSVAMNSVARASAIMRQLKEIGFCTALDDFGNGYSSLHEAAGLPVDELKLDRRLIQLFRREPSAFAVAGTTLLLGGLAGRRLIAEGIDEPADLRLWLLMGGEYAQGRLLAGPLPEPALLDWLDRPSPYVTDPVPVFPPRDLILVGQAFLEPENYVDHMAEALRSGALPLREWMALRGHLYGHLPEWGAMGAALAAGARVPAGAARDFCENTLRPATLALFAAIASLLPARRSQTP